MSKEQKFFKLALNELFKSVGFKSFSKKFTENPSWFTLKTWNKEQEDNYREWFIYRIKKDLNINSKSAELECSYFILDYGWKSKI